MSSSDIYKLKGGGKYSKKIYAFNGNGFFFF